MTRRRPRSQPKKGPPPVQPAGKRRQVVVDGSNLATEGRSIPSLAQLDEAVRAWLAESPDDEVIVIVDASFEHRIEDYERVVFEEAELAGELLSPPAGAVGRGDGFLLRIAHRTDATVLSNDSFQEFHGQYPWLFEEGRLVGGKPVPNVGWIFTPRVPVRGPKSRVAVRTAKKVKQQERLKIVEEPVAEAIAQATVEALSPGPSAGARRGRRSDPGQPDAVNEPLPFITFIAEYRLGMEVEGVVESFASHGAFVQAGGARCYAPVVGLGDPPPRSAKQVLKRGETRTFVVQALDPPRRGIELALPEMARPAGAPTDETVQAEIAASGAARASATQAPGRRAAPKAPARKVGATKAPVAKKAAAATRAPAKKASATKAAATKAAATRASATTTPAKKAAPAKKAMAKNAVVKDAPAKKVPAKKVVAKKASVKKATAANATATKATATKATATKATATKATATKATATKATATKATATKATATKATATKATATKATATKATATKAPAANSR